MGINVLKAVIWGVGCIRMGINVLKAVIWGVGCIRMGINVLKAVIWGGRSSDLWKQVVFNP